MESLAEAARRRLGRLTHRLRSLPVLVLMPHSRCNCRCLMCDIWRANQNRREISEQVLRRHLDSMRSLGVRQVVLSGGEPLMHGDLWRLVDGLREIDAAITLLSTGLLLDRHADRIVESCDEVIVSLDGSPETHDRIRRVPRAFAKLASGVRALREREPRIPITARCVLQRENYREIGAIVDTARDLDLDRISFLPVDSWSTAFDRPEPWGEDRQGEVVLDESEVAEMAEIVETVLLSHRRLFATGFVAESPAKMRGIVRHFEALLGLRDFDRRRCNAPWVSAVVEADGSVRPCFFHPPFGHLDDGPLAEVVNSQRAVDLRRGLDVATDAICRRCVCTLFLGAGAEVPSEVGARARSFSRSATRSGVLS